jgi:hypothetical protein
MRYFTLLLALAATPADAVTMAITHSWGKAGVPFESYRADAIACTWRGYDMDLSHTEAAKAFQWGTRRIDDVYEAGHDLLNLATGVAQVEQAVRPEQRMTEAKQTMQAEVDDCLISRGYQRFHLTAGQTKRLGRMKIGSDERRQYLYHLASDPGILQAQREPNPAPPPPPTPAPGP